MGPYATIAKDLAEEINSDQEIIEQDERALVVKKSALAEKLKLLEFAKRRYEMEMSPLQIKAKAASHRGMSNKLAPAPQAAEMGGKRQGRVISNVQAAIDALGASQFTPRDVEAEMHRQGTAITGVQPRARISSFLKDLATAGLLVVVNEGKGGIPNTYCKKSLMTEAEIDAIKNPTALGMLGF